MITFEEYIEGLNELEKEYADKIANAQQTSLILDRIIANAKAEKEKLYVDLDADRENIDNYKFKASTQNNYSIAVQDLRKALAKVYGVNLGDIKVEMYLRDRSRNRVGGEVIINVYKSGKKFVTYKLMIDNNTRFVDGAKLQDNIVIAEASPDEIKYNLTNGRKVKDLNININLTSGYMADKNLVEALRLHFKKQQKQSALTTK